MDIKVLGPIEVSVAGRAIQFAGERQRALVAVLTLERGNVVPASRLLDILWDSSPPATARTKLQAHVSALRRAMGRETEQQDYVVTRPPGYFLRSDEVKLDLEEFEILTAHAREALESGQRKTAAEVLGKALAAWRGPAFADIELPAVRSAAAAIDERRLLSVETKAETDLALGRAEVVAAELPGWVVGHPLRERLRALLMLALCRLGCRADALNLYRAGRELIVQELGLEPSSDLRRLHQRILADEVVGSEYLKAFDERPRSA